MTNDELAMLICENKRLRVELAGAMREYRAVPKKPSQKIVDKVIERMYRKKTMDKNN